MDFFIHKSLRRYIYLKCFVIKLMQKVISDFFSMKIVMIKCFFPTISYIFLNLHYTDFSIRNLKFRLEKKILLVRNILIKMHLRLFRVLLTTNPRMTFSLKMPKTPSRELKFIFFLNMTWNIFKWPLSLRNTNWGWLKLKNKPKKNKYIKLT